MSRKGCKNKRSFNAEELARKMDCDPLEILILFAMGDYKALGYENECYFSEKPDGAVKMGYVISPDLRASSAEKACKYLYSQKQAIEHSTGPEGMAFIFEDRTKKE